MKTYWVSETVPVAFTYCVEAGNEEEAISLVREMSTSDAIQDYWDWDGAKYDVEEA